jgi:hypothetical protein
MTEAWGAALYGQPCRECGFDWSLSADDALHVVGEIADAFDVRLSEATGTERHPDLSWTPTAYVCHVTDNLRIWAERLAGAVDGGDVEVAGYDQDLLARARNYDAVSLSGALWSLHWAADAWTEMVADALDDGVVLEHDARGAQRAEDVARNNAHDACHHLWDVDRILDYAGLRQQNST